MLTELRIRNFALIDQLSVRLGPGLNVLTGETGAGKSIVVGALSLLLGERASADVVRSGAERATVEGVFQLDDREALRNWLDERGLEADDGLLVLKREVALEGRNRAWVNGSPTTASLLGELGALLVSLHGQHEHQTLLRRDEQRWILDAYAGNERLLDAVGAAHARVRSVEERIAALESRRRDALQRSDFLRFQAEEIEAAALKQGEDEALGEEERRLSHAEELMSLAGAMADELTGDRSLLDRLGSQRRPLDQLVRIDPTQAPLEELFDTAYYALEELGSRLATYASSIEHDPARLDQVHQRQDLIFRLKAKYGPAIEDVLAAGLAAREELDLIDGAEWDLEALRKEETAARAALQESAAELTRARAAAAAALSAEVDAVLPELGMPGGVFVPELVPIAAPGPSGAEEVEFRVSLNRGFAPKPLAQVASGGELSRVMLALKTILARLDAVPTLVFDEVDSGVGGAVGLQLGDKMRQVARSHQVFAITHLPQIASRAHAHLRVRKAERDGITTTEVQALSAAERVEEIARMLGGRAESEVSLQHARELIGAAAGTEAA